MKKIKVNDNVLIITGKDKGKKGKVQQVFPKKGKLLIEGLNIYKRHMKAQSETQQAGIIDKEMFVDISNVALIDPNNNKPTRVGISKLKDKSKVRINKKTGEVIV
ncbi:MAG: 50S ribosomal protein L24 [Chloroflexi bacterium]|jgi:large subunit ribosomal protein L24|nr:50S ribosomal protein L24 [Chloroflexota bacterium]